MTLHVRLGLDVTSDDPSEAEAVALFNQRIDRDSLRNAFTAVDMDDSHGKDLNRILEDLSQLLARARASTRRKP